MPRKSHLRARVSELKPNTLTLPAIPGKAQKGAGDSANQSTRADSPSFSGDPPYTSATSVDFVLDENDFFSKDSRLVGCPGGCGYQVTWHPTHCCGLCSEKKGHGWKCERLLMPKEVFEEHGGTSNEARWSVLKANEKEALAERAAQREKGRNAAKLLEDSLKLVGGGSLEIPPAFDDWEVQTPADIMDEVRYAVHTKKPWRELPDDSLLEKKSHIDRGRNIPLPDVRVRLMEDELSLRVRCEILNVDLPPLSHRQLPEKKKSNKGTRKVQNPWYLPAKKWYCTHGGTGKIEDPEERSVNFPYAHVIYNLSEQPKKDEHTESLKQAYINNKDTVTMVEAYKQFMRGHRLPHFLL